MKKPAALDYTKDPTRPGGGVFILHGKGNQFQDVPEGTITNTSEREDNSEGEVMSPLLPNSTISSIMNYTGGGVVTPVSAVRSPVGNQQQP